MSTMRQYWAMVAERENEWRIWRPEDGNIYEGIPEEKDAYATADVEHVTFDEFVEFVKANNDVGLGDEDDIVELLNEEIEACLFAIDEARWDVPEFRMSREAALHIYRRYILDLDWGTSPAPNFEAWVADASIRLTE